MAFFLELGILALLEIFTKLKAKYERKGLKQECTCDFLFSLV